jgi:hypothetical protein
MDDQQPTAPHFLRVVRALIRVRSAAIPLAAAATTVASLSCSSTSSSSAGTGGYGGHVLGVTAMGGHGGSTSSSSISSSGIMTMPDGSVGIAPMPDAGNDH